MIKLKSEGQEKSEDFTIEFFRPLKIKKIALKSFSINVSWDNINTKFNNNKFVFSNITNNSSSHVTNNEITFPDGLYTVEDFNYYMIKRFGKDSPIKFGILGARDRITIKLQSNTKLDLSQGEFYKIIGFENRIFENYSSKDMEIEGKYVANISRGNDNIYIHCDIINGQRINENSSEVVYSFTNQNKPRTLISKEFDNLIFYPVKNDNINRIRMRITNQNGELIDLNNGYVEYNFIPEYESEDYSKKIYDLLFSILNK